MSYGNEITERIRAIQDDVIVIARIEHHQCLATVNSEGPSERPLPVLSPNALLIRGDRLSRDVFHNGSSILAGDQVNIPRIRNFSKNHIGGFYA